ncbi:hypothetical protein Sjap_015330 [Stephania japonica]|uniref:FHA domain-containing protein n=1 Tax=Stephania japonica TaxID=461633 RepID=A0AAP0IJ19_9MAGN
MKVPMGPPPPPLPPPRNPNPPTSSTDPPIEPPTSAPVKLSMGPPPPKNPNIEEAMESATTDEQQLKLSNRLAETNVAEAEDKMVQKPSSDSAPKESSGVAIPYTIPPWSAPPSHPFFLEVLKEGAIIDQIDVSEKGAYLFGRVELCDFILEHPTISRFHAVLQFKQNGDAYLYDIGSTHGTFINKNQVKKKVYSELHVGDVIRFGHSSRLYVFQGPTKLMPPEGDLEKIRNAKIREEMQDREASLLRAKREASLADGISWGMAEDAIVEDEEDTEEVTWQNHKGQLTERQEKTREKIIKRTQKARDVCKEIDSIRAKDISQGGLTQGQQTQIARNEQRISQIFEELESLEETLNDSIRESLGGRARKNRGKREGDAEEDDEILSDDDDFYDRTKKVLPSQKVGASQVIETAETLLEKKDAIMTEMEKKRNLLKKEKAVVPEKEKESVTGDSLDSYMIGLSSQIELDAQMQLQKDLSGLQSELDRVLYLLKIADPTAEAAKRRELKDQAPKPVESKPIQPKLGTNRESSTEQKKSFTVKKPNEENSMKSKSEIPVVENKIADEAIEGELFSVTKPQWLGATREVDMKEEKQQEIPLDTSFSDNFVDYKDRKKALSTVGSKEAKEESEIESAGPGLIIRKRKQVEESDGGYDKSSGILTSSSNNTDNMTAESEANTLKHNLGQRVMEMMHFSFGKIKIVIRPSLGRGDGKRVKGRVRPRLLNILLCLGTRVPNWCCSGFGRTSSGDKFSY